jgi:hypothetical protein
VAEADLACLDPAHPPLLSLPAALGAGFKALHDRSGEFAARAAHGG